MIRSTIRIMCSKMKDNVNRACALYFVILNIQIARSFSMNKSSCYENTISRSFEVLLVVCIFLHFYACY